MYANPLELAKGELGEQFDPLNMCPPTEADDDLVISIHTEARDHGFIDESFWVETQEGIVVPSGIPAKPKSQEFSFIHLLDLDFGGVLKGFHKFSYSKKFGSWFMHFDESALAPTMHRISNDKELWVPTAAVKKIEPL